MPCCMVGRFCDTEREGSRRSAFRRDGPPVAPEGAPTADAMSRPFKFCPRCAKPLEAVQEGALTRERCPDKACGFVHWNNPVPVVAAVIEHEGMVLLARNALWPEKFFGLVTG